MTRVSILTPSYNQAQFLPATIDSVLSQDYPEIEYLIVDGGSSDGSRAVLEAIRDPRVRWVSEKDKGQANALNKGLQAATGDILTFINSDDRLLPGAVRFAVEHFAAHPETDLLHGDCEAIDTDGRHLHVLTSAPLDLAAWLTGRHPNVHQPGTFWRRRLTDRIGLFDEGMHYSFDGDYWVRAVLAGLRLDYVPGERAQYRFHETSKTVSQTDRFYDDWLRIVDKVFSDPAAGEALRSIRPEMESFAAWHYGKLMWRCRQYDRARPLLRQAGRSPRVVRRLLSRVMLLETYTGTRLTMTVANLFRRLGGYDVGGLHW
ncbi:MAG: glycosyltransferase [Anaerolineae bacterium]|nr:glycosyltransferase [Anaerolineae bacterium]